jgi:hypothetical protein
MNVQLLWWEGCPSTETVRALVRETLDDLGQTAVEIEMLEIKTDEQALQQRFRGSPTILIDKLDLMQAIDSAPELTDSDAEFALTCRLYRRRDGRISPTPDPADVRQALIRAAQRSENQRS